MPHANLLKCVLFLAASGGVFCQPIRADDAALYDDPVPQDAVFVRILDPFDIRPAHLAFGGVEIPLDQISYEVYAAISAADLKDVDPGGFYSVVLRDKGPIAITEPPRDNASKVHLTVINMSQDPVRLTVPNLDLEVIGDVQSLGSAGRAVNPIKVTMALERLQDGAVLGRFELDLARGQNLTFVAGTDSARLIENRFGPVLAFN